MLAQHSFCSIDCSVLSHVVPNNFDSLLENFQSRNHVLYIVRLKMWPEYKHVEKADIQFNSPVIVI